MSAKRENAEKDLCVPRDIQVLLKTFAVYRVGHSFSIRLSTMPEIRPISTPATTPLMSSTGR